METHTVLHIHILARLLQRFRLLVHRLHVLVRKRVVLFIPKLGGLLDDCAFVLLGIRGWRVGGLGRQAGGAKEGI